MNENDYDEDGNNIVECPICLSVHCPSKEGGKCPEEDDFIKSMNKENTIVSKLNLLGKITEQHAKDIEEIIESIFQERRKENNKEIVEMIKEEMTVNSSAELTAGYKMALKDVIERIKNYD